MPLIKRYSNRKLYDTGARRYVTLEEISWMVRNGEDVTIIDHETNMDITAIILTQVVFNQEKRLGGSVPQAVFSYLIQARDRGISTLKHNVEAFLNPSDHFESEVTRRMETLRQENAITDEEYQRFTGLLLDPRFSLEPDLDSEVVSSEQIDLLMNQLKDLENEIENIKKQKNL